MSSEIVTAPHRTKPDQARCLENCMVLCWPCSKWLHGSHRPLLAPISVIAEALSTWSACHLGMYTGLALGAEICKKQCITGASRGSWPQNEDEERCWSFWYPLRQYHWSAIEGCFQIPCSYWKLLKQADKTFIDLRKNLADVWVYNVELGLMGTGGCCYS